MRCEKCEYRKVISVGMDSKGKEKEISICGIQPNALEINPDTNEKYGYEKLYTKHLNQCSPKWCPLKGK